MEAGRAGLSVAAHTADACLQMTPAHAAPAGGAPALPPGVRLHPHQVAGHRAEEGRTSALASDDGCFLKPLPDDERGACELDLYEARARCLCVYVLRIACARAC